MTHEVIIPGRTVIPPEGLITLELRNGNNGRLRKRVRVENAIMDWYKDSIPFNRAQGGYGDPFPSQSADQLNPLLNGYENSLLTARNFLSDIAIPNWYPGVAQSPLSWIFATPASDNVDAAAELDIPTGDPLGEVTAGAKLSGQFTADGIQVKRGTLDMAQCHKTWNQARIVAVWSTTTGNGTYRSIGFGSLVNQTIAPGGLRANRSPGTGVARSRQGEQDQFTYDRTISWSGTAFKWYRRFHLSDDGLGFWGWDRSTTADLCYWSIADEDFTLVVPAANIPGGGNNWPDCVETPDDFWIIRNGVLYRCVTPTTTGAISPVDTYDLSATVGTDVTGQALCWNGTNLYAMTDSHVYQINPTTGAITDSWAHGITAISTNARKSIEWDGTQQLLWLNRQTDGSGSDPGWGQVSGGSFGWMPAPDEATVHGFTTAGVKQKAYMGSVSSGVTDEQDVWTQVNAMTPDGTKVFCAKQADSSVPSASLVLPSQVSRAVLDADLVKTSDDTLTITYDFNFT